MPHTTVSPEDTKDLKRAQTAHPVHPLIRDRFSARAFAAEPFTHDVVLTLLEAAAWAPSSMNEQPWRYRYALRGTPAFDRLWECLKPGNQPWTREAAALLVCSGIKVLARDGSPNTAWAHDVGLSNANLLTQAVSMGIYGHLMGGIERAKAEELLGIDPTREGIVCFLALGYLGTADQLGEPFRTRELTPRTRRPLTELVTAL